MATEYLNEAGYLLIKVSAPWTVEAARQVIDEAKMEATKREYRRILFDLTQWSRPDSEMTRFYSGEYLAKVLAFHFKVAAFALPAAINKFGENTAVNRGARFRIFPDEASAVRWLLEGANQSDSGDALQRA